MWKEHSSTPTAAGVALGMVLCKAAVRVHALSVDVDRLDDPRLPTFAQSNMQGTVGRITAIHRDLSFCFVYAREGVRLGLVQPCSSCNAQPRAIGENCLTCDRRLRAPPPPPQQVQHGPGLKEIDVDGPTFKSRK